MAHRFMTLALITAGLVMSACSPSGHAADPVETTVSKVSPMNVPDIQFTGIMGDQMALSDYSGKLLLVVNTASKCGYTPQFEGLQALWTEYKDEGLVVLGIPSGDFGNQEFDDEGEVKRFCEINYGVDFPLTEKSVVKGADAHPFYKYAEETLGEAAIPKWNFHKILVDPSGVPIAAFPSGVKPQDESLVSEIRSALPEA